MHTYPRQKSNAGTIAVAVVLLLMGFFAYHYFSPRDAGAQDAQVVADPNTVVDPELMNALARIEALKIDTTYFDNSVYQSLKDQSVDIAPQPVGRPNPFAPISGAAPVKTTTKR